VTMFHNVWLLRKEVNGLLLLSCTMPLPSWVSPYYFWLRDWWNALVQFMVWVMVILLWFVSTFWYTYILNLNVIQCLDLW